ncbi:hypothetical protein COOONC_15273 [Cooperia oncophora]
MTAKLTSLEEEVEVWKRAAIAREKEAYGELEQLRARCENAEAARKAVTEKYNELLQECNETLSVLPLHDLTLNTPRKFEDTCKTSHRKNERRRTTFGQLADQSSRNRRAVEPVLNEFDALNNREVVEYGEPFEANEMLRLEMENNRLSQIICEKEFAIKNIYELQKEQAEQWVKERQELLRIDSLMKSQLEDLKSENNTLRENLELFKKRTEKLGASISACNDERCRLQQEIDELHSEKLDLEDRLQAIQNEQELMSTVIKGELVATSLDTDIQVAREQQPQRKTCC